MPAREAVDTFMQQPLNLENGAGLDVNMQVIWQNLQKAVDLEGQSIMPLAQARIVCRNH